MVHSGGFQEPYTMAQMVRCLRSRCYAFGLLGRIVDLKTAASFVKLQGRINGIAVGRLH